MIHYVVELDDGETWDVLIDPNDPSRVQVGGVERTVKTEVMADGTMVAEANGRKQAVRIGFEDGQLVVETADGRKRRARVELAEAHAWGTTAGRKVVRVCPEGRDVVRAPIAGNVAKLLVPQGTRVQRGQPIVVIEAMKMMNSITALQDGDVEFLIQPGQIVRAGEEIARVILREALS
jgi:biotin carboxyl carrier protein